MLGAACMGRAAHQIICNVERTIITLDCLSPFAQPSKRLLWAYTEEVYERCGMATNPLTPHFNHHSAESIILAYRGGALSTNEFENDD